MSWNRLRITSAVICVCGHCVMFPVASEWDGTQLVQMVSVVSTVMNILHSVKYQINCIHVTAIFSHKSHNDVLVNDGLVIL